MASRMHWVVLTTAPDQLSAEMWEGLLKEAGFPAVVRPGDTASYLGVTSSPCRLLVPQERLEEARAFLKERLGPDVVAGC